MPDVVIRWVGNSAGPPRSLITCHGVGSYFKRLKKSLTVLDTQCRPLQNHSSNLLNPPLHKDILLLLQGSDAVDAMDNQKLDNSANGVTTQVPHN